MSAISKAIRLAGSQTQLAKKLNVTPQAVQRWVSSDEIPLSRVVQIEAALNGEITREELRPDVFRLSADQAI